MDCLFCKIGQKFILAEIIYEQEHAVAFLDIHPLAVGHTVVIPKLHAETILDLPDVSINPVFQAVKRTTALLYEKLHPDGFTIGINHGRASGQAVEHLHIHIIPRFRNDGGGSIHTIVNHPSDEPVQQTALRLRGDA